MGERYPSAGFIEDGLFFVVTIIPLVYFFGTKPVLLVCTLHILSIPCAGLAHSASLDRVQTFLLSLIAGVTTVVDASVSLLCLCRLSQNDACCVFLKPLGIPCLEHLEELPLAIVLLPVSVFNCVRGLSRTSRVWVSTAPTSRRGIWVALLTSIFLVYAVLFIRGRNSGSSTTESDILSLGICYVFLTTLVSAADLQLGSETALVSVFLMTHVVVAIQAYLSLSGQSPDLFVAVAFTALVIGFFATIAVAPLQDKWTPVYSALFGGSALFVVAAEWSKYEPLSGTCRVAYFSTLFGRSLLLRADSFDLCLIFAVGFGLLDITAIVSPLFLSTSGVTFWATLVIAGVSLVVSIYIVTSRIASIELVKQSARCLRTHVMPINKTNTRTTSDGSTPNHDVEKNENAYTEGLQFVRDMVLPIYFQELEHGEQISVISDILDTQSKYTDSSQARTTMTRARFLRGVLSGLHEKMVDVKVINRLIDNQLLRLYVPKGAFENAEHEDDGKGILNVSWAPSEQSQLCAENGRESHFVDDIGIIAKIMRLKEPVDDVLASEVSRRYIFVASHWSFLQNKPENRMERFETLWKIVCL